MDRKKKEFADYTEAQIRALCAKVYPRVDRAIKKAFSELDAVAGKYSYGDLRTCHWKEHIAEQGTADRDCELRYRSDRFCELLRFEKSPWSVLERALCAVEPDGESPCFDGKSSARFNMKAVAEWFLPLELAPYRKRFASHARAVCDACERRDVPAAKRAVRAALKACDQFENEQKEGSTNG